MIEQSRVVEGSLQGQSTAGEPPTPIPRAEGAVCGLGRVPVERPPIVGRHPCSHGGHDRRLDGYNTVILSPI